ncbi:MAG: hypothetical protein JO116_07845 [Planctomycetaceae bacterium]|nr:hypothetical protein [Planctomycetaceae bacterium]
MAKTSLAGTSSAIAPSAVRSRASRSTSSPAAGGATASNVGGRRRSSGESPRGSEDWPRLGSRSERVQNGRS